MATVPLVIAVYDELVLAERLFAERGIGATSLRSVMAAAGADVAAVYHFGSKEGLLSALVREREVDGMRA